MALPTNVVQGNAAHVTHHNTIHALMPTGESVVVKTKAGVPVDGDFTSTPTNGTIALNTSTKRIWARIAGVWQEITATTAIQEEGAGLAQRSTMNFVGPGVTATDDAAGSRTKVEVTGTPGAYMENVKSYGAVGDGVADDTAAFVAALAVGYHLFIPPGTYKIALSLSTFQWKSFKGAGMEQTRLKAPPGGTAITFTGGFNHNFTFEDLTFVGATTPAEKGILAAGATTIIGIFHRVQFRDLLFGFDTNGTACETTGCIFTGCRFDNAPARFTGPGAHNTMVFDGKCRWAGIAQNTPALEIHNTGAADTNISIRGAVFESCNRQAIKIASAISVVIEDLYMEFNNTTGAGSLPWIDVGSGIFGLNIENGYFVGNGTSVFVGASVTSYSAFFRNNYLIDGTIDYGNFPDHTLFASGSEINNRIGGGPGNTIMVGGGSGYVGFHGVNPVARQNITGSRGGNAALADLLTKLAATGLISNSTT